MTSDCVQGMAPQAKAKGMTIFLNHSYQVPEDTFGKTVDASGRLSKHISESRTGTYHRATWIRSLVRDGLKPVMEIFDEVTGDGCAEEIAAIGIARSLGCRLVNGTAGGEGMLGIVRSAETRAKIGAASLGAKHTDEARAKMSAARKGVPKSAEWRASIGAAHVGMKRSEEARARMSAAQKGKKMPPRSAEASEKSAASSRGKKRSPEACARIAEGIRKARALKGTSNGR